MSTAKPAGVGRIVFLALMSALPPLSTDMYLVAIPHLAEQWNAPLSTVNLSLVLWFAAFSVSLLVCGTISDRFGRRPILLGGLMLFSLASVACALATGPTGIIIFRVLQGIAAAAPSSMTLAYCRDRYEGRVRQHILAWIGIIVSIAPMVAPSVGALIMQIAPWQTIFWLLALAALIQFSLAWFLFDESSATREQGGITAALSRYGRLARNRNFVLANFSMCFFIAPLFGYVGIASLVYMEHFGLSERAFALFFAVMPIGTISGSYTCTRLIKVFSDQKLLLASLIGCVTSGVLLLTVAPLHLLAFAGSVLIFGFFAGISRPLSNHLILEQVERDIGAASSTIIFTLFLAGAACMAFTTGGWFEPITAFGLCALLLPGGVLLAWPYLMRRLKFTGM